MQFHQYVVVLLFGLVCLGVGLALIFDPREDLFFRLIMGPLAALFGLFLTVVTLLFIFAPALMNGR
jgi:hypothetical protein